VLIVVVMIDPEALEFETKYGKGAKYLHQGLVYYENGEVILKSKLDSNPRLKEELRNEVLTWNQKKNRVRAEHRFLKLG